jgi:hypothetical protein
MTQSNRFDHQRFVKVSTTTLKLIRSMFGDRDDMLGREGAYFCASDNDGVPISTIRLGFVSRGKRRKYHDISEEKGERLALLNKFAGHTLSRESADDDLEHYTGGTRVSGGGYQISGFAADVDECGAVAVAVGMGDLDLESSHHRLKSNPLYAKGLDLVVQVGQVFGIGA